MSKQSILTGATGESVHTRSTLGAEESQAVVLSIDGSDSVIPADATYGLGLDLKRLFGSMTSIGQKARASALGVTLSNEDVAVLSAISAQLPTTLGTGGGLKVEGSTGETSKSYISTAAVIADVIKASAGVVTGLEFFKVTTGPAYVRLYDKATTPATTDTPQWRGVIGGSTNADVGGFIKSFLNGRSFPTGIGIRITGAIADNDNTALTANSILGNVEYI